ncbi:hypothetical protein [Pseudorhodoferax soli]|uniref:hypothetical protein n=1 Tax=Pseudorhodoferax soli TaxID=545864 RepID=UPI0011C02B2C|nr:hypothetical protein [Pseudorhodoferax soli]
MAQATAWIHMAIVAAVTRCVCVELAYFVPAYDPPDPRRPMRQPSSLRLAILPHCVLLGKGFLSHIETKSQLIASDRILRIREPFRPDTCQPRRQSLLVDESTSGT